MSPQGFSNIIWITFQVGVVEGGFKCRPELSVLVVTWSVRDGFSHILYCSAKSFMGIPASTHLTKFSLQGSRTLIMCFYVTTDSHGFCSITAYGYCWWSEQGHAAYDLTANIQKDWVISWSSLVLCALCIKTNKNQTKQKKQPPPQLNNPNH